MCVPAAVDAKRLAPMDMRAKDIAVRWFDGRGVELMVRWILMEGKRWILLLPGLTHI